MGVTKSGLCQSARLRSSMAWHRGPNLLVGILTSSVQVVSRQGTALLAAEGQGKIMTSGPLGCI